MHQKRLQLFSFLLLIIFLGLLGRLAHIQLISVESFSKHNINLITASIEQRTQSYIINNGRGTFIDRFYEPLQHNQKRALVIFPVIKTLVWPTQAVASILNTSPSTLLSQIEKEDQPFTYFKELSKEQMEKINQLKIPGMYALVIDGEQKDTFAQHLIGSTGLNFEELKNRYPEKVEKGILMKDTKLGISGLEKAFDPFIVSEGEEKLVYHADGYGGPLFGLSVKYAGPANPFYPLKVRTTIDKSIQVIAEEAVDQEKIEHGGIVILDIETNDVLAMVSRPHFDESDPLGRGADNEVLKSHIPGSIFKTVISAASIESGIISKDQLFNCNENLYGEGQSQRELGMLTFEESFAQSCNRTFAVLADEMIKKHKNIVEEYAEKLGIAKHVGWSGNVYHLDNFQQLEGESHNQFWGSESDKNVSKAVGQTAIGQLNVRLTPLAAANMMATIARGGEKKQVRIVSELVYKQGTTAIPFTAHSLQGEQITKQTAAILQEMLRSVVTSKNGTGHRFVDLPYTIAGKSGTAQKQNKEKHNKWFAGFFPYENPKYAVVVFNLENNDSSVNNAFEKVVELIYEYDRKTHPKT
ncbi:peptidoglycan D,D-transpeptidase FtsI family protein [Bacillus taeanensis]|uniref:serine-type D-Ala-D-Ala carboxypeptidase n=1 Tax=Bacillus taeanensis TaxID=273032 RepID=A0A366XXT1_9BACI|nr:penicillin-binding transpeptidase domain-containing protein [Bacillus taeanensis]RBW70456.1 penicillin-binding protein 2 [Bacillus taeanensis]